MIVLTTLCARMLGLESAQGFDTVLSDMLQFTSGVNGEWAASGPLARGGSEHGTVLCCRRP